MVGNEQSTLILWYQQFHDVRMQNYLTLYEKRIESGCKIVSLGSKTIRVSRPRQGTSTQMSSSSPPPSPTGNSLAGV